MPTFSPLEPPRPTGLRDTLYWQTPPGSATALALAHLAEDAPLLVITADTAAAQRLEGDLAFYPRLPVMPRLGNAALRQLRTRTSSRPDCAPCAACRTASTASCWCRSIP